MLLKHTWPHFDVGPKGYYIVGKPFVKCMNCDDYLRIKYCQNYGVQISAKSSNMGNTVGGYATIRVQNSFLTLFAFCRYSQVFGPEEYLLLDGADKCEYNPSHSTTNSDSPGWRLHRKQEEMHFNIEKQNILKLDVDAYAAMIICRAICTHRWYQSGIEYEDVFNAMVVDISSSWSEESKENRKMFLKNFLFHVDIDI